MTKFFYLGMVLVFIVTGVGCKAPEYQIRESQVPDVSAEDMFKALIADPVPISVRHIEGYGETSQGHNIYLKFIASQNFIRQNLINLHEYKKVNCSDKELSTLVPLGISKPPEGYKVFMPYWDIEEAKQHKNISCYIARGYKNKWTSEGESQILVDERVSDLESAEIYWTVYFHEVGI